MLSTLPAWVPGISAQLTMTNRPLSFLFHTCFMRTWISSFIGRVLLRTTYVFFYYRSEWVVLSCLEGPFICHSVIRNWQNEVFGDLRRLGEGGQLRGRVTTNDLFSAPFFAREKIDLNNTWNHYVWFALKSMRLNKIKIPNLRDKCRSSRQHPYLLSERVGHTTLRTGTTCWQKEQ